MSSISLTEQLESIVELDPAFTLNDEDKDKGKIQVEDDDEDDEEDEDDDDGP